MDRVGDASAAARASGVDAELGLQADIARAGQKVRTDPANWTCEGHPPTWTAVGRCGLLEVQKDPNPSDARVCRVVTYELNFSGSLGCFDRCWGRFVELDPVVIPRGWIQLRPKKSSCRINDREQLESALSAQRIHP